MHLIEKILSRENMAEALRRVEKAERHDDLAGRPPAYRAVRTCSANRNSAVFV